MNPYITITTTIIITITITITIIGSQTKQRPKRKLLSSFAVERDTNETNLTLHATNINLALPQTVDNS